MATAYYVKTGGNDSSGRYFWMVQLGTPSVDEHLDW